MAGWTLAQRLRARERIVGYWTQLPVPAVQERAARHGYDYVCFDAQHGFLDYPAILNGLIGVDAGAALAGTACGGMVRVAANDPALIGQALDAGAQGVIVPLIDRPEQAAAAVRACRFPPEGGRSYGPMRAGLRSGPRTAGMNAEIACVAMIETREGLDNLDAIAAVPGLDGLYVGPGDLMLALGAKPSPIPPMPRPSRRRWPGSARRADGRASRPASIPVMGLWPGGGWTKALPSPRFRRI
ncbi:aldolase/citrate lyase family protein [Paracoccus sp. DMF-8]|uniref:HpcH/HpaI aldolase family protein n=1 Tax=Paracoccus sp. DMF-8 TaxID=3019445 RepID=UPI0023E41864|nr:aldolase/citrate lyase family protein [Paracoccus sp. DMF-8]MDF3608193.1 aldolase/citrate lyase family protein [Paracoccus sp. DMF-8]